MAKPLSLEWLTREQVAEISCGDSNLHKDEDKIIDKVDGDNEINLFELFTPDKKQPQRNRLYIIMTKIKLKMDITKEDSDFLDSIDSVLVGHLNPQDFSKRETLCYYLNLRFPIMQSMLGMVETTDKKYYATKMYTDYKRVMNQLDVHIKRTQILPYTDFIQFMKKHSLFMPADRGKDDMGKRNKKDYFYNLPMEWKEIKQNREELKNIFS